jgi:hypothetical protein
MKKARLLAIILVAAAVCLAAVGLTAARNAAIAQEAAVTTEWSAVSVGCVPDDTGTTPNRYQATSDGVIKFETGATGDLFFWCDVMSPLDTSVNPSWNALRLTFKDSNASGWVEAKLYKKQKTDGAYGNTATLRSTDGAGVRNIASSSPIPALTVNTHAYYVRMQLHRDTTSGDPEFHIVGLVEWIW